MQKTITVKDVLGKCANTFENYIAMDGNGDIITEESNGILFMSRCADMKVRMFAINKGDIEFQIESEEK